MKKILLAAAVLLALIAYAVWTTLSSRPATPASPITPTTSVPSESTNPVTNATPPPSQKSGPYKDGSYTSPVADAFYGPLQFHVVIKNGKLTDVVFVQYPNANQHSVEVSSMSLPVLKQEAIAAQSANVNVVSGATQTSEAFQGALATTLAQAH